MRITFYLSSEYEEFSDIDEYDEYDEDDLVDLLNDYSCEVDPPSVRSASLITITNPPPLYQ